MQKEILSIPNITCGHCVMAIKNELNGINGVTSVEGDPENKQITVEWQAPADLESIKKTLTDINYPSA